MKGRLALKGGTALNLGYLGLARLSVDLDFNYIGAVEREAMQSERPELEQWIERIAAGQAYGVRRLESSYATTTWVLGYTTVTGGPDALRIQVNFLHRVPLFGTREVQSTQLEGVPAVVLVCVSPEELVSGKIKALVERAAARDLFDVYRTVRTPIEGLDPGRLRLAFLILAATMTDDVRAVTADAVLASVRERDIRANLLPMLRRGEEADRDTMAAVVRPLLTNLLTWSPWERAFLDAVMAGRIEPEQVVGEPGLQERIRSHPALRWKAENVAAHLVGAPPPGGRRRGRPRRTNTSPQGNRQ